jgi:hypothetical protein
MTSLGYSEWTATNTTSQKRVATIGKKGTNADSFMGTNTGTSNTGTTTGSGSPMNNDGSPMLLIPSSINPVSGYSAGKESFENDSFNNEKRRSFDPDKINAILDKMNLEEQHAQANPFENFEPINPPENIVKIQKTSNMPNSPVNPMYGGRAAAYAELANYQTAYTQDIPAYVRAKGPTGGGSAGAGTIHNQSLDRTLEKLNYLIHLLEQQQKEKTSGMLEDFLLYCLFGIFVIFIVDAFARYGKNVGMTSAKLRYKR